MTSKTQLPRFIMIIVLSLLATGCFQWGIGDPDKSQVDEKLVGVWYYEKENNSTVLHFRPFDKRTYFIDYMYLDGALEDSQIDTRLMVKGWHVKANNVLFLVTEWLGPFQDEKARNVRFTINQLEFTDDDTVRLRLVKQNYPALKEVKSQAEFEKVIRENSLDDEMYAEWYELKRVDYKRAQKLYHPN